MNEFCENIYSMMVAKDHIAKLLLAMHRHDPPTYHHCCRTAKLALQIGWVDMELSDLELLGEAAILHDVGKIMIDEDILNKPGMLTDSEHAILKKHARYGEAIVRSLGINETVTHWIANHHPEHNNLFLDSRDPILRTLVKADNMDAWIHERAYKPVFSKQKVTEMLYGKFPNDLSNERALHIVYHG